MAIKTSVFVAQFFNTGILIILVNASVEEAGLPFKFFDGTYRDFNAEWYGDVGSSLI